MISKQLQKKIDQSIALLQSVGKRYDGEIEVAYSGGKDSDVILQLAKEAGIRYRAIYKNTTIDPPGTIKHVQEMGVEIQRPTTSFFQLVAKKGFPSRFSRFCCEKLKEYKVLDKSIIGVRRSESVKRSKRYQEPTECRYYGGHSSAKNHVEAIYPILEWTDEDVRDFILDRGIKLASIYYDEGGQLDVTKRLGCMCCPMAYEKKRVAYFQAYPRMVRCYLRNGKKFWDSHPGSKVHQYYADIYEWFVRDVFYPRKSVAEWETMRISTLNGSADYKTLLEERFGIDLTL